MSFQDVRGYRVVSKMELSGGDSHGIDLIHAVLAPSKADGE